MSWSTKLASLGGIKRGSYLAAISTRAAPLSRCAVVAPSRSLHLLDRRTPSLRAPPTAWSKVATISQVRGMADKVIKVPNMAESITEGTLTQWHKKVGDFVDRDELIATIETDKVDIPVNSPEAGTVLELFSEEGSTVTVGGNLFKLDTDGVASASPSSPTPAAPSPAATAPAAPAAPKPAPEVKKAAPPPPPPPQATPQSVSVKHVSAPFSIPPPTPVVFDFNDDIPGVVPGSRTERRVKISRMRSKIAERLKDSQNTAASLTTFNEIDMSNLIELRKKYGEAVLNKYGIKLGFMSAFIKAATYALQTVPEVNARYDGDGVVYHDYADISVAVATPKGLVTPVIRNCESMSFIQVEKAMFELGKKARANAITIEELTGGTFTISNGGVFGSLMGTPIINQPQSAILGMHATKDRPVVVNGQIVIRPMMYVALTYDHRLVDGREAVTFLVKVKEAIEDPRRLLLEV